MESDFIWRAYAKQLLDLATSGGFDPKDQLFTTAGITTPIELGTDPAKSNWAVYTYGNAIPAWSPAYSRKSDIVSAYPIFLSTVLAKQPGIDSAKKQMRNLRLKIALSQFQLDMPPADDSGSSLADIVGLRSGMPMSGPLASDSSLDFDLMNPSPGGGVSGGAQFSLPSLGDSTNISMPSVGDDQLFNTFMQMDTADLMDIDWNKVNDPTGQILTQALDSYQTATSIDSTTLNMQAAVAGRNRYVPTFALSGDFAAALGEWKNQTAARTEISISVQSDTLSLSEMGMTSDAVRAMESTVFRTTQVASAAGKVHVSFGGFGAFPIQPGDWFKPGVIGVYKGGLPENNPFFGSNGALSLVPEKLLIGYMPELTLEFTQQGYSEAKKDTTALTQPTVGPFSLTVGQNAQISYSDDRFSVTYRAAGSLPVLLAVICTKL